MRTTTYRFEAMPKDPHYRDGMWLEMTEKYLRQRLAVETPNPGDLDIIIQAMKDGNEADDAEYTFRAVAVISEADYRVVLTTAPADYDGFGTLTLAARVGTDHRGQVLRRVAIDPKHWEWQTMRYASGLHTCETEERAAKFPSIFRLD